MKRLLPVLMVFGVFLLSVGESFALPPCPEDTNAYRDNCFGVKNYGDGSRYEGEFRDNKPNGQGAAIFATSNKYVGAWKDGEKNGRGIWTAGPEDKWAGDKYIGEFKHGFHGHGIYIHANGDKYVGEYKDGKRTGQGTYTHADGGKYTGEWKDGERHGQGTFTHADGRVKEGIWGKGGFKYAKKVMPPVTAKRYSESSDNRPRYCPPDHQDYSPTGKCPVDSISKITATRTEKKSPAKLSENTQSNLPQCKGSPKTVPNTYKNRVLTNVPSWSRCFGIIIYANGNKYVGEYKNGKRHGQGTYTDGNGNKYVGEFKNGGWHGQGTYTRIDGSVMEGIWGKGGVQICPERPPKRSECSQTTGLFDCSQ